MVQLMVQLLRREASCFEPLRSGFYSGSIPSQGCSALAWKHTTILCKHAYSDTKSFFLFVNTNGDVL